MKIADVSDNMNLKRIANPTEKDLARVEEYRQVLKLLDSNLTFNQAFAIASAGPEISLEKSLISADKNIIYEERKVAPKTQ